MRTGTVAAVCLILSAILSATDFKTDVSSESPFQRLQRVQLFAFGGVGFAGITSEGEIDFKRLMKQSPDKALADFEKLYATGTPEAKAYALAGIKQLNASRFRNLLDTVKSSTEAVRTMRGCVGSTETLGKISLQLDEGNFAIPKIP